jgi:hypothetical protein
MTEQYDQYPEEENRNQTYAVKNSEVYMNPPEKAPPAPQQDFEPKIDKEKDTTTFALTKMGGEADEDEEAEEEEEDL